MEVPCGSLVWVKPIFTTIELSTVIDQDPHDFQDRCTVIPARPARGKFLAASSWPVPFVGRVRPVRIGRSYGDRLPVLHTSGNRGSAEDPAGPAQEAAKGAGDRGGSHHTRPAAHR